MGHCGIVPFYPKIGIFCPPLFRFALRRNFRFFSSFGRHDRERSREPNRLDRIIELLERLQQIKEGEKERSPLTPKEKGEETSPNNTPRARA